MGFTAASLLCLSTALLPQQPDAPAAGRALALVRLLPADASAVVLVADPTRAATALAASPLGQLWQQQVGSSPVRQLAALGEQAGLPAAALASGMALACTGWRDGSPALVLVAETADSDVAAALQRLPTADVDGTAVGTIDAGELGTLFLATAGNHLLASTHRQDMGRLLRLGAGTGEAPLADDAGFRRLAADAGDLDGALAALFVRTRALVDTAAAGLPPAFGPQAQQALAALGLDRLGDVFASWRLQDGAVVGRARCSCPQLDGLLAALVGEPGRLDADLARLVPKQADGFVAAAVDLGAVARQVLDTVARFSPGFDAQFERNVAGLRQQLGIDLQRDVFDNFAGRLLLLSFPGSDGGHAGLLVEVEDAGKLAAVVKAASKALPVPLTPVAHAGATMQLAPAQADRRPGFAVVGKQLLLADDQRTLALLIDQVRRPAANPEVASFLQQQPTTATWVGRNRAGGGLQAVLARGLLGPQAPLPAGGAGHEWFLCGRDELGIVLAGATAAPGAGEPVASPLQPAAPAAETAPPPDPAEVKTLRELEKSARPDPEQLTRLLRSGHAEIAARAAWLAGRRRAQATAPALCELLGGAADAQVRLQAAAALLQMPDKAAAAAATAALADAEVDVRALAAQLLGKLGSTTAIEPLLAMLDERERAGDGGRPTDVVAGILALGDLGTPAMLLPLASAIRRDDAGVGQALAYVFQRHTPALPPREEATLLLAVLDHDAAPLRRYAMQRLGELRDPATAASLEGRLALEDRELQPVLQVALAAVRARTAASGRDGDLWQQARTNLHNLLGMAESRWAALDQTARMLLLGGTAAVLLALLGCLRWRARARRRAQVEAAAALVAASDDLVEVDAQVEGDVGPEPVEQEPQTVLRRSWRGR